MQSVWLPFSPGNVFPLSFIPSCSQHLLCHNCDKPGPGSTLSSTGEKDKNAWLRASYLLSERLSLDPAREKIYRVSQMAENRHLERNESWLADESVRDITFLVPGIIVHTRLLVVLSFYTQL